MRKVRKGFTLIELLVVIAIIALLLSILMPALNSVKNVAKDILCLNNLNQIGKGVVMYADVYDQHIPKNTGSSAGTGSTGSTGTNIFWMMAFAPYCGEDFETFLDFKESKIFSCPRYPDKEQIVDYVISSWGTELDGSIEGTALTKITDYSSPATKIYISDYASKTYIDDTGAEIIRPNGIISVIKDEADLNNTTMRARLDARIPENLPSWSNKLTWRVSGERHKREGSNALFYDGHADWVHKDDHIPTAYVTR